MGAAIQLPLVILDDQVSFTRFACDLASCKGACCTLRGSFGAPVTAEECDAIEAALPAVLPLLPKVSREIIRREGFVDRHEMALRCVDDRDCVFVHYEGDVAKCAIERAYFNGDSAFRKPLSCHLFPIRRDEGAYDRLRVEKYDECASGYARGAVEDVPLVTFVKDALIRAYGAEWYDSVARPLARRNDSPGGTTPP